MVSNNERKPKFEGAVKKPFRLILQHGKRPAYLIVEGEMDAREGDFRISGISGSSIVKLRRGAKLCAFMFFLYVVAEHVLVIELANVGLTHLVSYL